MTRPPAIHVRAARSEDATGIAKLAVQFAGGVLASREAREAAVLATILASPEKHLVLVVEASDEQVIAFGRASWLSPPPEAPHHSIPDGWYLLGLLVDERWRRQGIAHTLTTRRLEWLASRSPECYYFTSEDNTASHTLHKRFGFQPIAERVHVPGLEKDGPRFVLYRRLHAEHPSLSE